MSAEPVVGELSREEQAAYDVLKERIPELRNS